MLFGREADSSLASLAEMVRCFKVVGVGRLQADSRTSPQIFAEPPNPQTASSHPVAPVVANRSEQMQDWIQQNPRRRGMSCSAMASWPQLLASSSV